MEEQLFKKENLLLLIQWFTLLDADFILMDSSRGVILESEQFIYEGGIPDPQDFLEHKYKEYREKELKS
jgi:hypothetical protein